MPSHAGHLTSGNLSSAFNLFMKYPQMGRLLYSQPHTNALTVSGRYEFDTRVFKGRLDGAFRILQFDVYRSIHVTYFDMLALVVDYERYNTTTGETHGKFE